MVDSDGNELICLFHKFHKLKYLDTISKLSKVEFMILNKIMRMKEKGEVEPKITISNMAKFLSTTNPAASKMLSVMEDKGYIKRINDQEDKRVTYVTLTNEGEKIIVEAHKSFHEFSKTVIQKMGKQDLNDFVELFQKLLTIIEEEIKERG